MELVLVLVRNLPLTAVWECLHCHDRCVAKKKCVNASVWVMIFEVFSHGVFDCWDVANVGRRCDGDGYSDVYFVVADASAFPAAWKCHIYQRRKYCGDDVEWC